MKLEVKQKRIDEDQFLKMRKDVLSLWPTGKEVDLDEGIEYQKNLPESKNFMKITREAPQGRENRCLSPCRHCPC